MNRRDVFKMLTALPFVTRVQVAQPQPNDTLVIETDRHLDMESADRIASYVRENFPQNKCIVLGDGLKMKVVREQAVK